jgi:hypothetical protein
MFVMGLARSSNPTFSAASLVRAVDERAAADHVSKWGRFNTRMLEIETPVSIIVKSVPDEVRDDVTAAIEAVARQGSVPPSFNLVYFASSSPTNTASKTA